MLTIQQFNNYFGIIIYLPGLLLVGIPGPITDQYRRKAREKGLQLIYRPLLVRKTALFPAPAADFPSRKAIKSCMSLRVSRASNPAGMRELWIIP
jgi:hypothetical protein